MKQEKQHKTIHVVLYFIQCYDSFVWFAPRKSQEGCWVVKLLCTEPTSYYQVVDIHYVLAITVPAITVLAITVLAKTVLAITVLAITVVRKWCYELPWNNSASKNCASNNSLSINSACYWWTTLPIEDYRSLRPSKSNYLFFKLFYFN